jgi:hypothetical protein
MFNLDHKPVEKCIGCGKIVNGFCSVFLSPAAKFHNRDDCGMSTHITKRTKIQDDGKVRVGQQKQKKKTRGK